jgi:hypothetical protein
MILGAYWGNTLELGDHLENKVKLDGNTLGTKKNPTPLHLPPQKEKNRAH